MIQLRRIHAPAGWDLARRRRVRHFTGVYRTRAVVSAGGTLVATSVQELRVAAAELFR